ncbi:MAG: DUF4249 domain-containing protein [Bacteroidota bacterium]
MSNYLLIGILIGTLLGCTAPFDFEVLETEEILVVDASFTNETKAHTVTISYSIPLDGEDQELVSGANVWIEVDDGSRIEFEETSTGVYQTAPNVAGEVGRGYTLHATVGDLALVTPQETMLETIPIDSVYGRYLALPMDNGTTELGIQFLLDARGDIDKARSYRFDFIETHQIKLRFGSQYSWDQETSTLAFRDTSLIDCYFTKASEELLISTSAGLAENSIVEFPVRFVSESDEQLRTRYSLILKQYSISSSAYDYYREVKETNESAGSFFDEQRGLIVGNIAVEGDPSIPVLGYFEVAAVNEIRDIFVPGDFLDDGFKARRSDQCMMSLDTVPQNELGDYFGNFPSSNIVILYGFPPPPAVVGPRSCTDCRLFGEINKPDFWP